MAKTSKTRLVRDRLAEVQEQLDQLRARYISLQEEARKLSVALEVLEALSPEDGSNDELDSGEQKKEQSVVQRINICFSGGAVLTASEVITSLGGTGAVNERTVRATLSRLVKTGVLEKASQNSYRLPKKEEAVSATNTDGLDLV